MEKKYVAPMATAVRWERIAMLVVLAIKRV
jgi:hypothetical protein